MIYFTSDTHFNHNKEFIYSNRHFTTIEEMNNNIIKNWNNTVSQDDDIYVLGDFFLGTDLEFIKETIDKLNGNIHLIIGNHDTKAKLELYKQIPKIVEIVYATQIKYKKHLFYLSHYPTITGNFDKNMPYNLFGHTHSIDKFYEDRPYMYNVACDAHNCYPISIEQIYTDIKNEFKLYEK